MYGRRIRSEVLRGVSSERIAKGSRPVVTHYTQLQKVRGKAIKIGNFLNGQEVTSVHFTDNERRTLSFCAGPTRVVENKAFYMVGIMSSRRVSSTPKTTKSTQEYTEDFAFLVGGGVGVGDAMKRVNPKWKATTWVTYLYKDKQYYAVRAVRAYIKQTPPVLLD